MRHAESGQNLDLTNAIFGPVPCKMPQNLVKSQTVAHVSSIFLL